MDEERRFSSSKSKRQWHLNIPQHERDDIEELNLTNAEWMRRRLSGELPERAEPLMRQRLSNQLFAAAKHEAKPRLSNNAAVMPHQEIPATPEISDYTEFTNWALEVMKRLQTLLFAPENFEKDRVEIFTLTNKLYHQSGRFALKTMYDEPFQRKSDEYLTDINAKVENIFKKNTANPEVAAVLMEMLFILHETIWNCCRKDSTNARQLLGGEIQKNHFNYMGILMDFNGVASNIVFSELKDCQKMWQKKEGASPEIVHDLTLYTTMPVIRRVAKTAQTNGLEATAEASEYLSWCFRQCKQDKKTTKSLQDKGFDLQRAANFFLQAIYAAQDSIISGEPSHYASGKIIDALAALFQPVENVRYEIPLQLSTLLRKFYQEKVIPYSSFPNYVNFLHKRIKETAQLINLDFNEIIKDLRLSRE